MATEPAHVELPYKKDAPAAFELPGANWFGSPAPAPPRALPDPDAAIAGALAAPLERPPLRELLRPGERIALLVDDHTRATPAWRVLRHVSAEFEAAGVLDADVTVVVGGGTHRPSTPEEARRKIGEEAMRRFRVVTHDCRDEAAQVFVGVTSLATPVWINAVVADADRRITIGHVAPSPYAGYGGGGKLIVPGVAALDTVNANHSLVPAGFRKPGRVDLPARLDIDEAVRMVGVDMEIDLVLDSDERVVAAFAGSPEAVYREGLKIARPLYEIALPSAVDVAVTSGEPYSIDLYQATRAVEFADCAVREGGSIVLVADCPDGVGGEEFYGLMASGRGPDYFLRAAVRREMPVTFAALGYSLARIREEKRVHVMTDNVPADALVKMGFVPCHDLQAVLDGLLAEYGPAAKVAAFPRGSVTIPYIT